MSFLDAASDDFITANLHEMLGDLPDLSTPCGDFDLFGLVPNMLQSSPPASPARASALPPIGGLFEAKASVAPPTYGQPVHSLANQFTVYDKDGREVPPVEDSSEPEPLGLDPLNLDMPLMTTGCMTYEDGMTYDRRPAGAVAFTGSVPADLEPDFKTWVKNVVSSVEKHHQLTETRPARGASPSDDEGAMDAEMMALSGHSLPCDAITNKSTCLAAPPVIPSQPQPRRIAEPRARGPRGPRRGARGAAPARVAKPVVRLGRTTTAGTVGVGRDTARKLWDEKEDRLLHKLTAEYRMPYGEGVVTDWEKVCAQLTRVSHTSEGEALYQLMPDGPLRRAKTLRSYYSKRTKETACHAWQ